MKCISSVFYSQYVTTWLISRSKCTSQSNNGGKLPNRSQKLPFIKIIICSIKSNILIIFQQICFLTITCKYKHVWSLLKPLVPSTVEPWHLSFHHIPVWKKSSHDFTQIANNCMVIYQYTYWNFYVGSVCPFNNMLLCEYVMNYLIILVSSFLYIYILTKLHDHVW